MLALLAAPALVTLTFAPLPLTQALERLSAATGRRLVCSPALRDEVLIARLKDADETRVLKEIATCLDARWSPQPSRVELVPDPSARDRREATEQKARADAMAKDLTEGLKPLVERPAFGRAEADALLKKRADAEKKREEREREGKRGDDDEGVDDDPTPASRAMLRLAKAIGPTTFASMRSSERIVFAENPTPMQREFSGTEQGALDVYRREHALTDPSHGIERVRLAVKNDGLGGVDLMMVAFDASGTPLDAGLLSLSGSEDREDTLSTKLPTDRPLALPHETEEYLAVTARNAKRDALFDLWRPKIADPVAYEPTAWYPGAALLAAAEAQDRNLIGSISDLSARMRRARGPITAASLLLALDEDVTVRDGWIVARPKLLRGRVSRPEARALFAQCVVKGGLDIDTAADWCARYPEGYPAISWVGDGLAMLASRSPFGFDVDSLAFWGTLSPTERTALRDGRPLPLATLAAASQEFVAERIYWSEIVDPSKEPTELLPRGVLGGRVAMKVEESPVAVSWAEGDEPLISKALSPDLYGMRAAQQERTQKVVSYGRFRMGVRRTYTLSFDFPGLGSMATQEMSETFFDPKGEIVDRLPDDFAKLEEAAKQKALSDPDDD